MTATVPVGFVLAATGALFAFAFALIEPTFVNVFWQIGDGNEILRTGHLPTSVASAIESTHLVAHEWLFEVAAAAAAAHGTYVLLVVACALAAAATPLLVYALARASRCSTAASGVVALLTIGTRFIGTALRPETFAVDFLALELLVLARALPIWCALPIAVLWANVHASAVLSFVVPVMVAGVCVLFGGTRDPLARRAAWVGVLAAIGTLATPFGLGLWSYAWSHGVQPDASTAVIRTWEALSFSSLGAWTAVLPGVLVFALCGLVFERRHASEIAVTALFALATLVHQRYAVFLAVGWAVPMARALDIRSAMRWLDRWKRPAAALAFAPIVLAAAAFTPNAHRFPSPTPQMAAAAAIAQAHRLSGNAYVDIVWASYLVYRGLPLRMLVDGHADGSFPPSVWADTFALQQPTEAWQGVLDRRSIRVVMVPARSPLAQVLANRHSWQRIDERGGVVAYVRRAEERPRRAVTTLAPAHPRL